jgi:hypothetical protein
MLSSTAEARLFIRSRAQEEPASSRAPATKSPPPTQFQIPNIFGLAIVDLLNQPLDDRIFQPITYLGASHEVFGITLIVTWIVTLVWFPEQIFNHPARPIIGSFNPCFGCPRIAYHGSAMRPLW